MAAVYPVTEASKRIKKRGHVMVNTINIVEIPNEEPALPAWVGAACTGCGKCCLDESYMGSLPASVADVRRWKKEGRHDILQYVAHVHDGIYDLWVIDGIELLRCPFVRKNRGQQTYRCTIHETRPDACRNYPVTASQMLEIGCEIVEELERVGVAVENAQLTASLPHSA